jgi:hypothetical protein
VSEWRFAISFANCNAVSVSFIVAFIDFDTVSVAFANVVVVSIAFANFVVIGVAFAKFVPVRVTFRGARLARIDRLGGSRVQH